MSDEQNRRVHARYNFRDDTQISHIKFGGPNQLPIRDISYSGFSISQTNKAFESASTGSLWILGEETKVDLDFVHQTSKFSGFCFRHRDANALIFLREVLELFRTGSTLSVLDKSHMKEEYQGEEWLLFRGDGPCDLVLRKNGNKLDSAQLTFADGTAYNEFRFKDGKIKTGTTTVSNVSGQFSTAAQIIPDDQISQRVLRAATALLLGVEDQKIIALLEPIFKEALPQLAQMKHQNSA